jgi:tetratricopeptide (TPR) repeat protein
MKGPKKDMMKLSEHGIVTEEALIAYLNNQLSDEEKQQLEKLMLDDPFARDALEGLQSSANKTAVSTSISSLNKKVRERSGLRERKKLNIHWVTYAWAATLIGLLIGIGIVMINFLSKTDHNLALNEKKEKTETPAFEKKDTLAVPQKSAEVVADSSSANNKVALTDTVVRAVTTTGSSVGTINTQVKPGAAEVKANNAPNQVTTFSYTTTASAPDKDKKPAPVASNLGLADNMSSKDGAYKTKISADSTVVNGYFAAKNNGVTSAEFAKKELKQELTDYPALQDKAMKSFNSADYNSAADDFDKILKHDPENADALYFGGISDYINGKWAKSEINFDKLLKKGNSYTDGSKWYKANILLKKGKTDAAKTLLQDLTNTNGSYKERAIKKLAELGF